MIIDWEVPRYVPCDADDDDAPDIWSHPDIHLPAVQDSPRSVTKGLLRPTATNSNPVEETEILGRSQFGDHPHSPTFCSQSVCVDIFAMLNFCDKILYLILKHSWGQSHTFCSQPHNWRNCDHFLSSKLLKFNGRVRYSNSITDVFHTLFKRPLTLTPHPLPPPGQLFCRKKHPVQNLQQFLHMYKGSIQQQNWEKAVRPTALGGGSTSFVIEYFPIQQCIQNICFGKRRLPRS